MTLKYEVAFLAAIFGVFTCIGIRIESEFLTGAALSPTLLCLGALLYLVSE